MRNFIVLAIVCAVLGTSILLGSLKETQPPRTEKTKAEQAAIPHIGQIEVLNGSGISGAAGAVADFLRQQSFDVKNIGNAETWNYPFTIIVSHCADMNIARQVAEALRTDKVILMRESKTFYDVTVLLGPDFGERIE